MSLFNSALRALQKVSKIRIQASSTSAVYFSEWGSGAGKGGGSGGAVRDAGGTFGKLEAAREEEYFKKLQRKQLMKMKNRLKEEISHHEKMIMQHKEAIERHLEQIKQIKHEMPPKLTDTGEVESGKGS